MNTLSIQIDEQVKSHFNQFTEHNKNDINDQDLTTTQQKIDHIRETSNDAYIMNQIAGLESMIKMINDDTWTLSPQNIDLIHATIRYFVSDNDLIPDHIPGIGYIDDCIVIDNTLDAIEEELIEYKDFSRTRVVYAKNETFTLSDWHKVKDQESVSRIRNRRNKRSAQSLNW